MPRWIDPTGPGRPQGRLNRGLLRVPSPAQIIYDPGTVGPPPDNTPTPGVLGEVPPVHIGSYDLRPWEQPFDSPRWNDWQRKSKPVWGETVTLRVVRRGGVEGVSLGFGPFGNIFSHAGLSPPVDTNAYLSILISTWNDTIGKTPGPPNRDPAFAEPVVDQDLWQLQTRLGPNILPDLAGVGSTDVDLIQWAHGARFIGVWLWYYWAGSVPVPTAEFAWECRDDTPSTSQLTNVVSWPVREVSPVSSNDLNAVFRYNALPSAERHSLAVFNGGAAAIDADFQQFAGANVQQVTSVAGLGAGMGTLINSVDPDTHNPYGVLLGHNGVGGTTGPVVLSLIANQVHGK